MRATLTLTAAALLAGCVSSPPTPPVSDAPEPRYESWAGEIPVHLPGVAVSPDAHDVLLGAAATVRLAVGLEGPGTPGLHVTATDAAGVVSDVEGDSPLEVFIDAPPGTLSVHVTAGTVSVGVLRSFHAEASWVE